MAWSAVVWAGFVATTIAAAFFWVVRSLGWTQFSPTAQLGCLVIGDPRRPTTEALGLVLLYALGALLVPALYSVIFGTWQGPSWTAGLVLGGIHGLAAAAAVPLIGMISACVRRREIPPPGLLGLRWGRFTPVALVLGHLVYGGIVGGVMAGF